MKLLLNVMSTTVNPDLPGITEAAGQLQNQVLVWVVVQINKTKIVCKNYSTKNAASIPYDT